MNEQKKTILKLFIAIIIFCSVGFGLPFLVAGGAGQLLVLTHPAAAVTSISALLNGELASMGGSSQVSVWFEYGKTSSYGSQGPSLILYDIGTFQTNISNLSPCALYYFRAVAQNQTGKVYGSNQTFFTQCPNVSLDLLANSQQGPVTVGYNQSVTLSWTSSNANVCQSTGDWTGPRPTSGSFNTGPLTISKNYVLTCYNASGASVSDSVAINVSSQPTLNVSLQAVPSSGYAPLNNVDLRAEVSGAATGPVRYRFDCSSDGVWERDITISDEPYSPYIASSICYYSSAGTYTAKVRAERGGLTAESQTQITVSSYSSGGSAPQANAGQDKQVYEGGTAILQGSAYDPDANPITYFWSCNGGNLNNYSIAQPTYTAPAFQVSGTNTYTCTLTARDSTGLASSDSMFLYVLQQAQQSGYTIRINTFVQNLTKNGVFGELVYASSSDDLLFKIVVEGLGPGTAFDLYVKDTLPNEISYVGDLKIDNVSNTQDITLQAINIGNLSSGSSKTITFKAKVKAANYFTYGATNLVNSALVYNNQTALTDTCTLQVIKPLGVTDVDTGVIDSLFNSLILPILVSLGLVWVFKSQVIGFDKWAEQRKEGIEEYRAKKKLQKIIAQIRGKI